MRYRTCPCCGANLDPDEACDCTEDTDREEQLNEEKEEQHYE